MTHASRNTITGLIFENEVQIKQNIAEMIEVSKHKLYTYLKSQGLNYLDYISKKLLPDEAYIDNQKSILYVYEKKYQQTAGSADEKPQTCAFKIYEYRKLAKALNINTVYYIYIFNDWFRKPEYKDMLEYIKSVDGCDYIFAGDINGSK